MVRNKRPRSAQIFADGYNSPVASDLIVGQLEAHIYSSTNELLKNTKYLAFALLA